MVAEDSSRTEHVSSEHASDALRDQAIRDLNALIAATDDARADLRAYRTVLEKNRRHLAGGGRVSDFTELSDIPAVRSTLTERLTDVERARMTSRRSLWRLELSEGATIAEIAREWGLSRQLVSRALANAEADSGAEISR